MYLASAIFLLALHLLFVLWVIFGALFTDGRRALTVVHISSFVWGLVIEIIPWTCPLTFGENWLEQRAGISPYQGGCLLHCLDLLVYPGLSPVLLTAAAALVCAINVAIYWRRWRAQPVSHVPH